MVPCCTLHDAYFATWHWIETCTTAACTENFFSLSQMHSAYTYSVLHSFVPRMSQCLAECLTQVTQQTPLLLFAWLQQCLLIAAGCCPPARMGHTAVLFDSTLVIFGGRISPAQPLNDIWALDIPSCTWHCIHCKGVAPSARFRHTAVTFGSGLQVGCSVCHHFHLLAAYQWVPSNYFMPATCALPSPTRKPLIFTNHWLQTVTLACKREQEIKCDDL